MIEVEAKIRISDVEDCRRRVLGLARYVGKERKIDDYYTLESLSKYPKRSLRIRRMGKNYVVNFKQRVSYKNGVHAKKEVEFRVSDIAGFLALIDNFGFRKWLRKKKVSEIYEVGKNFHIEINNVRGLGWFVEVEYLSSLEGVRKARRRVFEVIKKLGASKKDIVKDGYTKMLWDKK